MSFNEVAQKPPYLSHLFLHYPSSLKKSLNPENEFAKTIPIVDANLDPSIFNRDRSPIFNLW